MGIREGLLEMGDMALSNENVLMGNMRLKLRYVRGLGCSVAASLSRLEEL